MWSVACGAFRRGDRATVGNYLLVAFLWAGGRFAFVFFEVVVLGTDWAFLFLIFASFFRVSIFVAFPALCGWGCLPHDRQCTIVSAV